MNARRSLTPAARGVSLAVLAALRAGRVDLADQADGSTLATSTAPDGTELLRATLRMPVRGADPRQLTLPAVAPVPQPAEAPPAPVAVPAGEEPDPPAPNVSVLCAEHGLAVGDIATLDDEDFRVTVADEFGWQGVTVATTPRGRPLADVHCDWGDVERVGERAWRTLPRREKTRAERTEGPPVSKGAKKALKREVEHVEGNRWRVRPVDTETPAQQREAARPKRAAKAPKAAPARNVPVPEADDLAVYGQRSVVAIIHEGGPWELVWSDEMPGHMTYDTAVSATTAQAHRVRVYHRGKRCVRDSKDGAT